MKQSRYRQLDSRFLYYLITHSEDVIGYISRYYWLNLPPIFPICGSFGTTSCLLANHIPLHGLCKWQPPGLTSTLVLGNGLGTCLVSMCMPTIYKRVCSPKSLLTFLLIVFTSPATCPSHDILCRHSLNG